MKNTSKVIPRITGLVVITAIGFAVLSMTGCPTPYNNNNETPETADFSVIGLSQIYDGSPKTVTVTPKQGKSGGEITVKYNGSTTAPLDVGSYNVTFNVAAAVGWNAARGLSAGTLEIAHQIDNPQTPVAADFEFNFMQTAGKITAVTVTPKQGKSAGIITVYYNGSTTFPTEVGMYAVTFDVAAALGWNAVSGLSAGYLNIGSSANENPEVADYDINGTGTFAYDGSVKTVTVTAKSGKSAGAITVKYNGSVTAPSAIGVYNVTFDVAAAAGWNAARGLRAGILTVTEAIPTFTSITALGTWLSAQPANTADAAYTVTLNVDSLGNDFNASESIKQVLNTNSTKYVNLDLSGSTITTIPNNAFYTESPSYTGCHTLVGITIPDGVTGIGNQAFFNCANLATITIPDSVTTIGDLAFCNCTSLADVTIPDGITSIGNRTFAGCISLTGVNIPDGVTSIGTWAFSECRSLTDVTIPNKVTSIGNFAFYGCVSLTSITIPDSVTSIGEGAFSMCTNITGVNIPDGVTYIAQSTFYGCASLVAVTIPNGVLYIGSNAFSDCTDLTSVTIGNSVISIGSNAFSDCSSLTMVTIPNSVISIGRMAFWGCTGLTGVTIPNSVSSIGSWAFRDCADLASVTFQGIITSSNLDDNAFDGDLRDKYMATGIGIYTTENPGFNAVWTKQ